VEAKAFIATVLSNNGGVESNLIRFPTRSSLILNQIPCGILFIFAVWSGPAIQAFKQLTSVLASRRDLAVPIFVLNTDEIPEAFFDNTLKVVPAGAGETFWIKDGGIVHTVRYFKQTSSPEIIQFTESLLTGEGER
jgi:hypothetical protein